jgi:hypothetical protein
MLRGEIMTRQDTAHIDHELSMWRRKLDTIITKFEALPSGKKAKLTGYIRDIHMLAIELDDRIELLKESGYDDGDFWDNNIRVDIDEFRSDFTETSGTFMDYDYSG